MDSYTTFFTTYGVPTPPCSPQSMNMHASPYATPPTSSASPASPTTPPPSRRWSLPGLVRPGLIARLDLGVLPPSSVVYQQPWVNAGAHNHPILVLGITPEGLACCAQSTSFGKRTLEEKYASSSQQFLQMQRQLFLPIRQLGRSYYPDVPVLDVEHPRSDNGHQGYINMCKFFFIEPAYLRVWRSNKDYLTQQSIEVVQACMRSILAGTTKIPAMAPGRPSGPLDFRRYSPEELGIAVPTMAPYVMYGVDYAMAPSATGLLPYEYLTAHQMQMWPHYGGEYQSTSIPQTSSMDEVMAAIQVLKDYRCDSGIGWR